MMDSWGGIGYSSQCSSCTDGKNTEIYGILSPHLKTDVIDFSNH